MESNMYVQSDYPCRLLWGRSGALEACKRADILVVVDVLSFSSTAATAAAQGVILLPVSPEENMEAFARQHAAQVAVGRGEVPARGHFSLSPITYLHAQPGTRVVLASPNGAAL